MRSPGAVLQDKMNKAGMSRKELALRSGVTEKHICTILNGNKAISPSFARKLGYVFEDAYFWLKLQAEYDTDRFRAIEKLDVSQEEINISKSLDDFVNYFIECGYISDERDDALMVIQLRDFLGVSNLLVIPKITFNALYKTELANNVKADPYALFAWQRMCEKEMESFVVEKPLDKDLLQKSVPSIKRAMFGDIDKGIQELRSILADCGIALYVVKSFRGAPVQGFLKESSFGSLSLCLTVRAKRADRFWFTLFHEIGHILIDKKNRRLVDFDAAHGKTDELADNMANEILIPSETYRQFLLSRKPISREDIYAFAHDNGVQPFVVFNRLQKDGYLEWIDYPDEIVHYDWA